MWYVNLPYSHLLIPSFTGGLETNSPQVMVKTSHWAATGAERMRLESLQSLFPPNWHFLSVW